MTATVHRCPPDGTRLTACCGKTLTELPHADRITSDPARVTCSRKPDAVPPVIFLPPSEAEWTATRQMG